MNRSGSGPRMSVSATVATVTLAAGFAAASFAWWSVRRERDDLRVAHAAAISQLQELHAAKGQLERANESEARSEPDDERVRGPVFLKENEVGIEYLAHSCFRIYTPGGTRILIDPWASNVWVGYQRPQSVLADSVDAVLITHPHYDHDAGEFLGRRVSWPAGAQVIRGPGNYPLGDVQVRGIRGKHAAGMGKEFDQKNTIYVLEVAGLRIVHWGDNELSTAAMSLLGRVDILMLPVDSHEHLLTYGEVAQIRETLRPKVLIPMHYRHPELERSAGSPHDLGPIEPWLAKQVHVRRLPRNTAAFSSAALAAENQIVVFPHSPIVKRPKPSLTQEAIDAAGGWARLSPFTDVRQLAQHEVLVEYAGQWYELIAIDDLSTEQLLHAARDEFGDSAWMRFAVDLVEVMQAAGARPGETVRLVLQLSGKEVVVDEAPLTSANREQVRQNYRKWLSGQGERN